MPRARGNVPYDRRTLELYLHTFLASYTNRHAIGDSPDVANRQPLQTQPEPFGIQLQMTTDGRKMPVYFLLTTGAGDRPAKLPSPKERVTQCSSNIVAAGIPGRSTDTE